MLNERSNNYPSSLVKVSCGIHPGEGNYLRTGNNNTSTRSGPRSEGIDNILGVNASFNMLI